MIEPFNYRDCDKLLRTRSEMQGIWYRLAIIDRTEEWLLILAGLIR